MERMLKKLIAELGSNIKKNDNEKILNSYK